MIPVLVLALALSADPSDHLEASTKTLSLEQALQSASRNQPTLRQQHATTLAADARADEAFAPNLPQVGLDASYRLSTNNNGSATVINPGGGVPTSTTPNTTSYWSGSLTATQTIWDFQQTWGRYRAAQSTASAQSDTERANTVTVNENVRTAYFTARANRDLVAVANSTLHAQMAHLDQTKGFVEAGTQPEIALAQSKANVANARVQFIQASNNYATAKAALNTAMGVEGPTDYEVTDTELAPVQGEDGALDKLVDQAYAARPESAAFEAQLQAEDYTLRSIRGAYWPSFGASASGTLTGDNLFHDQMTPNLIGQLTMSWNLYQGGLTNAQVQEAESNRVIIEAQRDAFHLQVRQSVEQAQLAVHAAKEALTAADEALDAAKAQLTLAEGRYQAGVGNIIELSDAQATLTSSAAQRVSAVYSVATARAQLMASLGIL
ncbi:MAG: TolC family protein [Deltaproteobacteria bacterium]|nr:TolC family protein [Deltaproteobacteria bacterium]